MGAALCTCIGRNRIFHPSSGSCLCEAGYIFYDETDRNRSEGNNKYDCQSIVDSRCTAKQVRDSVTRECVDPDVVTCQAECAEEGGGQYDPDFGRCFCNSVTDPMSACNRTCLSSLQPKFRATVNSDGSLTITEIDPATNQNQSSEFANVIGPNVAPSKYGETHFINFWPTGISGVIPTKYGILDTLTKQLTDFSNLNTGRRRLLGVLSSAPISGYDLSQIANPIFCVEHRELVIFKIYLNTSDRPSSHYPVYVKDSLLNTNPRFDFSSFTQLKYYIENTNVILNSFAYTFDSAGKYLFADSQSLSRTVLISAQPPNTPCPKSVSRINPSSVNTFNAAGVKRLSPTNLATDWGLIIGVLVFLAVCIILILVAVIVWKTKHPTKSLLYRWQNNSSFTNDNYIINGKADGSKVLEDLDARKLFDKLNEQNQLLKCQLSSHTSDTKLFYQKLYDKTEQLRLLIERQPLNPVISTGQKKSHPGVHGDATALMALLQDLIRDALQNQASSSDYDREQREINDFISSQNNERNNFVIEENRRFFQNLQSDPSIAMEMLLESRNNRYNKFLKDRENAKQALAQRLLQKRAERNPGVDGSEAENELKNRIEEAQEEIDNIAVDLFDSETSSLKDSDKEIQRFLSPNSQPNVSLKGADFDAKLFEILRNNDEAMKRNLELNALQRDKLNKKVDELRKQRETKPKSDKTSEGSPENQKIFVEQHVGKIDEGDYDSDADAFASKKKDDTRSSVFVHDEKELQWDNDYELIPLSIADLKPRHFIIYKYGQFILRHLEKQCGRSPITLLIAKSVPANRSWILNAFRNSFHYNSSNKLLYIRQARLESVGEFTLLLIHCSAHIDIDKMMDDTSPDFLREFHHGLSVVYDDLFLARCRSTTGNNKKPVINEMFNQALKSDCPEESMNKMLNSLIDMRTLPSTDRKGLDFGDDKLPNRLQSYKKFSDSQTLMDNLLTPQQLMKMSHELGSKKTVEKLTEANNPVSMKWRLSQDSLGALSGHALYQSIKNSLQNLDESEEALDDTIISETSEDKIDSLNHKIANLSREILCLSSESQDTLESLYEQRLAVIKEKELI